MLKLGVLKKILSSISQIVVRPILLKIGRVSFWIIPWFLIE